MYEKIIKYTIITILVILTSCKSTKVLSDNGIGVEEHREIQSDIRDGETELAITGSKIESESKELGERIRELEQSIRDSETNEQELGKLIQQIRKREITEDKLIELGIIKKE